MNTLVRIRRILPLGVLAALVLGIIGVPASQGADPFIAGGRSTRAVDLPVPQAERAKALARRLATALEMPGGVVQRAERLEDRFEHRTYDEVTSLDDAGREVAITRLETDGTVAMAVVLNWHPGHGSSVDASGAQARGLGYVRAAGLVVANRPTVLASGGSGGWSISWPRVVDGTVVRGDGIRVVLWADGTFHGLSRSERPLAPAPERPMTEGIARTAAEAWAAGHLGAAIRELRVVAVERAWVAPNDTFAPNDPDAPAATLRLAWAVRFETQGALAERLRAVEVWLDAGNGTVLGGDAIE
jgi:hypothetical protein